MIYAIHKRTKEHLAAHEDSQPAGEWGVAYADADGWISGPFDDCPLPWGASHEVRFDDGRVVSDNDPTSWCWSHDPARRIVAYRPILEQQATLGGAKLWQDAEGTIPVRRMGEPVGRVDCDQTGNAWTSSGDGRPVYRERTEPTEWGGEWKSGDRCLWQEGDICHGEHTILASDGDMYWIRDNHGGYDMASSSELYPIRSEEERAVDAMNDAVRTAFLPGNTPICKAIYRAISVGLVPGVRLED